MMEESRKVYGWLALLSFALLALSAFAGPRVVVSQLPEPVRALAEVETNVVFSTGAATDNKWTLTIERDAVISNSVEVVFGCDANEDGVLGIEEGGLSIGWDCGEWFWRDRRANAACRVEGTAQRLDMALYLARDREAKSLASSVFRRSCRLHASTPTGILPALSLAARKPSVSRARFRLTR